MELVRWILFGGLLGMFLHLLDFRSKKGHIIGAVVIGGIGAFNGTVFARLFYEPPVIGEIHFSSAMLIMISIFSLLFVRRILELLY